jgi:hypothetical protein
MALQILMADDGDDASTLGQFLREGRNGVSVDSIVLVPAHLPTSALDELT